MGIDVGDPKKNGDEAKTGKYTGGKGGDYEIVGNEADRRQRGGRPHGHGEPAAKNKDINVVYTINEPTAAGAYAALKAAGKHRDVIVVSVDGGWAGVRRSRPAHRRDRPAVPAEDGRPRRQAIANFVNDGTKPTGQRRSRLLQHRCHADRRGPGRRRRQQGSRRTG